MCEPHEPRSRARVELLAFLTAGPDCREDLQPHMMPILYHKLSLCRALVRAWADARALLDADLRPPADRFRGTQGPRVRGVSRRPSEGAHWPLAPKTLSRGPSRCATTGTFQRLRTSTAACIQGLWAWGLRGPAPLGSCSVAECAGTVCDPTAPQHSPGELHATHQRLQGGLVGSSTCSARFQCSVCSM